MSPTNPDFCFLNPDRPSPALHFNIDFSAGSSDAPGFNFSKSSNGKSDIPSRSRPRLMKTRRKKAVESRDGESVKTDLRLNGFSGGGGEVKFDGQFGNSGNSEGLNGSKDHVGNGSVFGVGLTDCSLRLGMENGKPVFGSTADQNSPAGVYVFGQRKSGFPVDTNLGSGQFEFVVCQSELGRDLKFSGKDSGRFKAQPKVNGFKKSDNAEFMFGSDERFDNTEFVFGSGTQKQDSDKDMDKSESNRDAGYTFGGSKKVDSDSSFPLPFSCNFTFGSKSNDSKLSVDLDNKPAGESKNTANSKDNVKENGVFVFGRMEGKWGLSSSSVGCTNTPDTKSSNWHSSIPGVFSDKDSAFSISDEMSRLNIGSASEVDTKKTENLISSFSVNSNNNAFVFGRESPINVSEKTRIYANSKSLGGKSLKKKTKKLKDRTVVQQLFGQDRVSKESDTLHSQMSPGFGSPMDFSPYQDTKSSSAPGAEKYTSEHCEKSDDGENSSDYLSPSLPARDGLTAVRCQYKKKYKLKVGLNHSVQGNSSDKENVKQDTVPTSSHETCEYWRIRGNQAYHDEKLSKAEEFYTTGIDFALNDSTQGHSIKPLLLCYSNRAATRMCLRRMREAICDCTKASVLDPNFLKVTLRAGNCYLVLGEVEDAIKCYSKCVRLGRDVCLDRRITIEAADGLQKAKRVAELMDQSSKLLQGADNSTRTALKNIEEALSISRFSEKLLQMKGEALCSLRMHDEVIQLCEQTLEIAKMNFGADVKLWRCHLQAKSHFQMGRLDLALDLIEKQEKMPIGSRSGDVAWGPTVALAATIRELLSLKKSGNEAFNSGRYTEAIENYTCAITKSVESRSFMAICFCNRAAAYQSTNQIVEAIADCSLAISLNENYEKAISRRATLHVMIRDYKQAVHDLQRLISLLESHSQTRSHHSNSQTKSNGGSARETRKVRRLLSSVEEKAKEEIHLNLYLILGIKASDSESEIKKAYRKAALRHHPDKVLVRSDVRDGGSLWKDFGEKIHKDADRVFKIIGEAYAVLSDPSKRSKYDNEEEMRNINRDINRNSNSGCASTSYSSPYERGYWFGRQASSSSSSERDNRRYYWNESRSRW